MYCTLEPKRVSESSFFEIMQDMAKRNNLKVSVFNCVHDGEVKIEVLSLYNIKIISLTVKSSEIEIASEIIIDVFEEKKIWK